MPLIFQAFPMSDCPIRNIAIIVHVDQGKIMLVASCSASPVPSPRTSTWTSG